MIKLLDRVTNQQILLEELSGHIVPGRYLLCEDTLINQHTILESGVVLSGDGTENLRIDENSFKCIEQVREELQARHMLVGLALPQIAEAFAEETVAELPSPLLPSQLFSEEGTLNRLEELLDTIMSKGHLQEISRRPRYDMRYDEMVQPVSRSKRLASSSHRHLSAHSECWQSRTLTGIQPKKVLSLVSEDEYNLYENRVFARLVDRLERYLNTRLNEIIELQNNLNDALKLEGSKELDFRLSRKLCELWGGTFTSEAALLALDVLEQSQLKLSGLLKKVKGLTQGELYKRIPRNAQVTGRIRPTNILTHDQHYRHLLPLWNTLLIESKRDNLTPAETLELNQRLQGCYGEYCQLILIRAMKELHYSLDSQAGGVFHFSRLGRKVSLHWTKAKGLKLTDSLTNTSIILIPIYSWDTDCPGVVRKNNLITIPCSPNAGTSESLPSSWVSGENDQPLLVSPMDLYVEERMVSLLNYWLLSGPLKSYAEPINKVPTVIMEQLGQWQGIQQSDSHSFRILSDIDSFDLKDLQKCLRKNNARASIDAVNQSVQIIKQLSHCPACQSKAKFEPRDKQTFIARCRTNGCEMEWTIQHTGTERQYKQYVTSDLGLSFADSGRWLDQVVIS